MPAAPGLEINRRWFVPVICERTAGFVLRNAFILPEAVLFHCENLMHSAVNHTSSLVVNLRCEAVSGERSPDLPPLLHLTWSMELVDAICLIQETSRFYLDTR